MVALALLDSSIKYGDGKCALSFIITVTTVIIKSKCMTWHDDDDNKEVIKNSIDGLELMYEWN